MGWVILIAVLVPLLLYFWHSGKASDRPDAYKNIRDRPVIPAVILDIDMPFASMVVFMTKIIIAMLPALILVGLLLTLMFGGLFAALL
jgi:hypothetical protein